MNWKRRYVAVDVYYMLDPKIIGLQPLTELCWLRILACAGRSDTDGFVSDSEVAVLLQSVRSWRARVVQLVDRSLLIRDDDNCGYIVVNWPKWQRPMDQVSAARERDRERKRLKRLDVVRADSARTGESFTSLSARNPTGKGNKSSVLLEEQSRTEPEHVASTPPPSGGAAASHDASAARQRKQDQTQKYLDELESLADVEPWAGYMPRLDHMGRERISDQSYLTWEQADALNRKRVALRKLSERQSQEIN